MDWQMATLALLAIAGVRLAVPLTITAGICVLLDRLCRRWEVA